MQSCLERSGNAKRAWILTQDASSLATTSASQRLATKDVLEKQGSAECDISIIVLTESFLVRWSFGKFMENLSRNDGPIRAPRRL
jgi:hypothetical protein